MTKQYQNNIKVLFICHGNILKNPGKACKINGFTKQKGIYYTTTTPFLKESRCDRKSKLKYNYYGKLR